MILFLLGMIGKREIIKVKYHYFFPFYYIDSKRRNARVFVKGFFITRGANPLKASPDLKST